MTYTSPPQLKHSILCPLDVALFFFFLKELLTFFPFFDSYFRKSLFWKYHSIFNSFFTKKQALPFLLNQNSHTHFFSFKEAFKVILLDSFKLESDILFVWMSPISSSILIKSMSLLSSIRVTLDLYLSRRSQYFSHYFKL